jgi:hypothetical protein
VSESDFLKWGGRVADDIKTEIKAKRTSKNSVFLDLFQDKNYLLKMYQTLHPEDTDTTQDELDIVTITNVLTDNLYNDLGVLVGDDKLLLLIEAQSTWTENILVRILLYLAHSYHEYFGETSQSLYKSTKVKMPKPELYVIYTGDRKGKPDVISLSEEFFGGADVDVEVKAKVIYESNTDDIINQYIIFCKVFDDQRKLYGLTEQTVRETIRICKDRNVLKEYLESREKEVVTIMMSLFDEEQIMKVYLEDCKREMARQIKIEAEKEGIKEGERRTARDTARRLLEMGKLSVEEIAAGTGLTVDEVKEIESGIKQLA